MNSESEVITQGQSPTPDAGLAPREEIESGSQEKDADPIPSAELITDKPVTVESESGKSKKATGELINEGAASDGTNASTETQGSLCFLSCHLHFKIAWIQDVP